MQVIKATQTAVGVSAFATFGIVPSAPKKSFEIVLRGTHPSYYKVVCRPLAKQVVGGASFPEGGEITLEGTADKNGFVGSEDIGFESSYEFWGFEVVSITSGASVDERLVA